MAEDSLTPEQELKIVQGFVSYYRVMSQAERVAAMKLLGDEFCVECGVVHGDQCTCFKGFVTCEACDE